MQLCLEHCQRAFLSQHCVSWWFRCIDQFLTCIFDCLLTLFPYVLCVCGYISSVTQGLGGPEPVPDLRLTHTGTGELHWRHGLFSWCSYLRRTWEDLSCNAVLFHHCLISHHKDQVEVNIMGLWTELVFTRPTQFLGFSKQRTRAEKNKSFEWSELAF